jgi:2-polyprenyl-3-methyl-5-hydroxy-6-metoxy-1,4-benzoquinol methylase
VIALAGGAAPEQERAMSRFTDRLLGDAGAFVHVVMAAIGDRLGIWRDFAARGPATSMQLARRMGLSERHVREWLAAMASAQYLDYDAGSRCYSLRGDHAAVLGGPLGALPEVLVSYLRPYERLVGTFELGGGVPQSAYPPAAFEGSDRIAARWYEHALVAEWLPAAGLDARLAGGVSVCDVGCGGGGALVELARVFPRSRFVGYDVFGPNVHRARERAQRARVADRVQFHQLDAAAGLPARFDVITTFDVVHDAVAPQALFQAIRAGLHAGGTYLCLEPACGPHDALLYGISVLYSVPTSLAHGGLGLGACGVPEEHLRKLAATAGFATVERLDITDPFNALYTLI